MPFSVYIDESGEAGINKVREGVKAGASPCFVLGAAVFQPESEILARKTLERFKSGIRRKTWKHATDLKHAEKVYFARLLSNLPIRFFSVISNKATLGEYKRQINGDAQKFYNKCLAYLLERICAYLKLQGVSEGELSFILEERNHDYDRMLRYLSRLKENPLYPQSRSFSVLNPFSIVTRRKGSEELLEIADFVSHAVYQCANKTENNFNIPEPRYFVELSSRFGVDQNGNILGAGLKCIHSLQELSLDSDIQELLKRSQGPVPPKRKIVGGS